ncbi:MAG: response regulator [Nocardioidaceae bacterium]
MREPATDAGADRPPTGEVDDVEVILADDHPVFRDGLAVLLDSIEGIRVVGRAGTGREALDLVAQLHPDVVVMDVNMPDLDGIEATRRLTMESPHVGVVVLTMAEDDDTVFAAMRAGARGYLLKEAGPDDIVRSITAVAHGEAVFGAAVARRIMDYFASGPPAMADAGPFPELTPREREVLDLVAAGRANPDIARALFLSPKTVRNIVSNVFAKLHVADRAEAIIRARDAGLGRG